MQAGMVVHEVFSHRHAGTGAPSTILSVFFWVLFLVGSRSCADALYSGSKVLW
jgi:hypothetical protein